MKKKTIALLLACMMTLGIAIGGTLAWLTDETEDVVNTFTTSDVDISITETGSTLANGEYTNSYKMIPGYTIAKDPKVTVKAGSEACWLFVKLTESGGVVTPTGAAGPTQWSDFLTYTVGATGVDGKTWTELTDAGVLGAGEKVYYIQVDDLTATGAEDVTYNVIVGNTVSVKKEVTKEMMDALKDTPDQYPKLTVKAYAVQYKNSNNTNFSASDAWKETADYVAPPAVNP